MRVSGSQALLLLPQMNLPEKLGWSGGTAQGLPGWLVPATGDVGPHECCPARLALLVVRAIVSSMLCAWVACGRMAADGTAARLSKAQMGTEMGTIPAYGQSGSLAPSTSTSQSCTHAAHAHYTQHSPYTGHTMLSARPASSAAR